MKIKHTLYDATAISLSALCTIHCLMLPLIVSWLPAAIVTTMQNEVFHVFMVLLVIPLSLFALFMGCKKHKNYSVLSLGGIGLLFLISAVLFGHDYLGEVGEKAITVIGSGFIATSHFLNYYLCGKKENDCCECDSKIQS